MSEVSEKDSEKVSEKEPIGVSPPPSPEPEKPKIETFEFEDEFFKDVNDAPGSDEPPVEEEEEKATKDTYSAEDISFMADCLKDSGMFDMALDLWEVGLQWIRAKLLKKDDAELVVLTKTQRRILQIATKPLIAKVGTEKMQLWAEKAPSLSAFIAIVTVSAMALFKPEMTKKNWTSPPKDAPKEPGEETIVVEEYADRGDGVYEARKVVVKSTGRPSKEVIDTLKQCITLGMTLEQIHVVIPGIREDLVNKVRSEMLITG